MRVFALISMIFLAAYANAQNIKMKIASVTATAGEDVIALQFIDSNSVTIGGSGGGFGRAFFDGVEIKKMSGLSSIPVYKKSIDGSIFQDVTFEFYDAANVLYYKIVLKDVTVKSFAHLSPECNNCTKLYNQIRFLPIKYEVTDVLANLSYKWNVAQNQSYQ